MLVAVQPALSQTLPNGKQLLPRDTVTKLALVGAESAIARTQVIEVSGQPFAHAVRATTTAGPRTEWGVQLQTRLDADVKKDDVLLARFSIRCVESMTGEAFAGFVLEQSSEPYDKSVEMRVGAEPTPVPRYTMPSP